MFLSTFSVLKCSTYVLITWARLSKQSRVISLAYASHLSATFDCNAAFSLEDSPCLCSIKEIRTKVSVLNRGTSVRMCERTYMYVFVSVCLSLLRLVFWLVLGSPFLSRSPRGFSLYYFEGDFLCIIIFTVWEFFESALTGSLSQEFEWQQVSSSLLNILTDLSNAVVWIVSTRSLISKSSSPFTDPLMIVPRTSITICITVTFMFHSFFQFPGKVQIFTLLFTFFQFYYDQPEQPSLQFWRSLLLL